MNPPAHVNIEIRELKYADKTISVGVPEGWQAKVIPQFPIKGESVDHVGAAVIIARAGGEALLTLIIGSVEFKTANDFNPHRYVTRAGWKAPGGGDIKSTRLQLWGGDTKEEVFFGELARPGKPPLQGFATVVGAPSAGPQRPTAVLVVGLATAQGYAADLAHMMLAVQSITLTGLKQDRSRLPAVLSPVPADVPGPTPLEGVYWDLGSEYRFFRRDGLAARFGSIESSETDPPPPVPFDEFPWLLTSAVKPSQVGWYTTDASGAISLRFPGAAKPQTFDAKRFRRLDVPIKPESLVGSWAYAYESRPGSDIFAVRHYAITLRADGTFEDSAFQRTIYRGETYNPTFDPMRHAAGKMIHFSMFQRADGKGAGKYTVGRGQLVLEYSDGRRAFAPIFLEGDVLYFNGDPCKRRK